MKESSDKIDVGDVKKRGMRLSLRGTLYIHFGPVQMPRSESRLNIATTVLDCSGRKQLQ